MNISCIRERGMPIVRRFGLAIVIGAVLTITSIPLLSGIASATLTQNSHVIVCERSAKVRDAIVAESPVSACGDVTALHLKDITALDLSDEGISSLSVGEEASQKWWVEVEGVSR